MSEKHDKAFYQQRTDTFDKVIALIDEQIKAAAPAILLNFNEISADSLYQGARKEIWSLFLNGIRHLKNGAPDGQPGSMTEALSKISLRSSTFTAALGVKPPQFEQMYFTVNYTTGHEAALFFCRRLIEAAEGDLSKSTQIIRQKMAQETPASAFGGEAGKNDANAVKRQMVLSFNVLAETYGQACQEFKSSLSGLTPPTHPKPDAQSFNP
jgi:hypothetical protein